MRKFLIISAVLVVAALTVSATWDSSSEDTKAAAQSKKTEQRAITPTMGELETSYAQGIAQIEQYVKAVQANDVARYVEAVQAQEAQEAAAQEAAAYQAYLDSQRPATVQAPTPAPSSQSNVTGACGGATNGADQYIMRESGGDPNAYNPSGAWGCYQIMPGTWAGAGCNDLGSYGSASAAAQAACASRLPDSAWAL